MAIADTQTLFLHELCEIYDAEHRFIEGQQEMEQNATNQELREAIHHHLEQTRQHARNLEEVFSGLGEQPRRESNEVAKGLVNEARESIQQTETTGLRDCAIDAAVAKVEHFEMGSYRSLVTAAQLMGEERIQDLLSHNMSEEEETARIAETTAMKLLRDAMKAEGKEPSTAQTLMDKAKDRLTGR
jgi:ferritin-like metal-binding protein YciE